jgi:PKD repeat protein
MKRVIILALVASIAILCVVGCNDESKPHFTRMFVTPDCGVVPLQVDGYAIASGGDETGDPTGGNNNLDIQWNFGDGASSYSSITFHEFVNPGEYSVVVTGTDASGNVTTATKLVTVLADTLVINALIVDHPDLNVTTADVLQLDLRAEACSIDPDLPEDYRKMEFEWIIEDFDTTHTFYSQNPVWNFTQAGTYTIYHRATLTSLAVTRWDTLLVSVTAP